MLPSLDCEGGYWLGEQFPFTVAFLAKSLILRKTKNSTHFIFLFCLLNKWPKSFWSWSSCRGAHWVAGPRRGGLILGKQIIVDHFSCSLKVSNSRHRERRKHCFTEHPVYQIFVPPALSFLSLSTVGIWSCIVPCRGGGSGLSCSL